MAFSTVEQHLCVVVGFNDQIVGLADERFHLFRDVTSVCDEAKHNTLCLNAVAHIVSAVVRNGKGGDAEVAQLERLVFLDEFCVDGSNLLSDAVVLKNTLMDFTRSIDGQVAVAANLTYRLDVVGMIVGDENVLHLLELQTVVLEVLFQRPYSHASIDEQPVAISI